MADQPRVIQPIVVMQPPPDPEASYDDGVANRFIEDTATEGNLTFQQWLARDRPLPVVEGTTYAEDVPEV